MIKRELKLYTVKELHDVFSSGKIIIPDYQREGDIWTTSDKQYFIDSIYNNFSVPKFYIRTNGVEDKWELVEGQQRLAWAIDGFIKNKFNLRSDKSIPQEMRESFFCDLDSDAVDKILNRVVEVEMVECTREEVREMFDRLNRGRIISSAERRNGIEGDFRDSCIDLSEHKMILGKVDGSLKRFKGHEIAAQVTMLEIEEGPRNLKAKDMEIAYKAYADSSELSKHKKRVKRVLNEMYYIFKIRESYMNFSNFLTIYLFFSELIRCYTYSSKKVCFEDYNQFFDDFYIKKKEISKKMKAMEPIPAEDMDFVVYNESLSNTVNKETLETRHSILMKRFLDEFPEVKAKDTNRFFTREQKEEIHNAAGKTCEGVEGFDCPVLGEVHELGYFEYDHDEEHADGGLTTIANGRCRCPECHSYKTSQNVKSRKSGQTLMF